MKRVMLGKSGLVVSELVFGTLAVSRLQANLPPAEGAKVIGRAVELGIDCIDTAQVYGSYEHVAAALKELGREANDLTIISKSLVKSAQGMREAVEEARLAMKRDVIDAFHLHAVCSAEDFRERAGAHSEWE